MPYLTDCKPPLQAENRTKLKKGRQIKL